MKKYTKKIMAMVTVAATMVTGTAIPVMADDAPTIRLITWLTPSNPAQKPSYDDTKKQAIIDIVDYLYSTEMQEIGLYNAGDIPARNDVEIDDAKVTVPLLADIIAYGKGKESCPNFPQTCPKAECWTDFADGFDELFAGISTPDEVIEHIDESLESAKN